MQTMLFKQNREKCFLTLNTGCCFFAVNVGVVVPLVTVPVAALALGGLGFALCRKKM